MDSEGTDNTLVRIKGGRFWNKNHLTIYFRIYPIFLGDKHCTIQSQPYDTSDLAFDEQQPQSNLINS